MTHAVAAADGTAGGDGPLLKLESLAVSIRGTPILRNVSLEVAAGEIVGLVGASGAGKSMTALAIARLLPPQARLRGTVLLRDRALTAMSETQLQAVRGRDIGIIFQEPMTALNPLMRIGDQVAETVMLHRSATAAHARSLAREALDTVGLRGAEGALDRYPHELSGGQRQRVAIAIAAVLAPALLIADEPTTALDVAAQAEVLGVLRELARVRRTGVIFVSHDLAVISRITDRILIMQHGEIIERLATRDFQHHMRHPYAKALLAAAALEPERRAPRPTAPGPAATRAKAAAGAAAAEKSAALLEVRGIVREYPGRRRSLWHRAPTLRAVDGASLTVYPGETVGLVGESGAGKSSLLRAILAVDRPQAGEVRLLGEGFSTAAGARLARLRRNIQMVFQDPYGSFDPRWRVERLIAEPLFSLQTPPAAEERKRRVAAALEQVGLSAADAQRYPGEFSGGQRQRIAIARALITEPAVIVFDEAVSALDVLVRGQILQLLARLVERLDLAYLFVSHDLNVVRCVADRVYVMHRGRIVEEGPTASVFSSPQHPYTRSLIAATPRIGVA
jgi:peptide/nickel transport system ATP-binding protein